MTSLSLPSSAMPAEPVSAQDTWTIHLAHSLDEVESLWRSFEGEAVASPYQRFDWVKPYAAAMLAPGESLRIVTVEEPGGRLAMILPLVVGRQSGLRVASPLGGKHANFNVPLMRPGCSLAPDASRGLLARIGRQLGVDLVICRNAPQDWRGVPNPFAAGGQPSPSNAYKLRLESDAEATFARVSSTAARKKLRNKERGLAKLGAVALLKAATEAEIDLILDAVVAHKKRRFGELGITDPYGDEASQGFVRSACLAGLSTGRPGLELYGLTLDGTVIAALGGAGDREQLSGMFISFDITHDAARFSPGEILVADIIRTQCAAGRTVFDLGVGEARYKRIFCDEVEHLADCVVPVTALGRLYGVLVSVTVEAKRRFKASPRAMRLLALARRARSTGAAE
jgi:CelD/BcsL family acetyltransferase involved in cellulose biosynthesis